MRIHLQRVRVPLLGAVRVAGTAHGVVGVRLDDDEEALLHDLLRRFPGAELRKANAVTTDVARAIRAYLGGGPEPDVHLLIPERGFSARVWRQIASIP